MNEVPLWRLSVVKNNDHINHKTNNETKTYNASQNNTQPAGNKAIAA